MADRLRGKVALVTGSAMGMGRAHVEAFVREGACVIVSDVADDAGRAVAATLGDAARYVHLDVTSADDWQAAIDVAVNSWGKVDVLCNNAGFVTMGSIEHLDLDDWDRQIRVMQYGPLLGMRAVMPAMRLAGGGSIINISSTAGLRGAPGIVAYCAAKFALRGMTKVAALEFAGDGVRVNSVHPGTVDTPFVEQIVRARGLDERPPDFGSNNPAGRMCTPGEVAHLVVFLASDESQYCSGAEFVIDSGQTASMGTSG